MCTQTSCELEEVTRVVAKIRPQLLMLKITLSAIVITGAVIVALEFIELEDSRTPGFQE
jgi:hypothetical protein